MLKSLVYLGLSALSFTGGLAHAAENCGTYTVIPGDTLRLISERYYGQREFSPTIYEANAAEIGENPNAIEIGMELAIPCRENMQTPDPIALLALIGPEKTTVENTALRFLAKAGDTPFVKQDSSGVIPDILSAALRSGGYIGALDITRPSGISDVLQVSTEPGALLSFPWTMPTCSDPTALSPQSVYLCNTYSFSEPLYEITLGMFTTRDHPLAAADTASSFEGKSICVSQFHTPDLLYQNGIAATSATIVLSADFESCLAGLKAGEFDAIVADYQSFGALMPNDNGLVDIPAFAQKSTLHAIAYSHNPAALEVLAMANSGLKQILMSGEWFGIVNQHLAKVSN
ncbi:MAG: transporter substrate-binding domain-containing protein [Rhodobacteraceae bacterium]|nr:transporter substrate-binding domain-containing protein [Paracoccaceae bacterium]